MAGHPLGDGAEFHRFQKGDQFFWVGRTHREFIRLFLQRHIDFQGHQLEGNAGILGILDQGFAALILFDLAGTRQKRFDIAIDIDQFRRRLDPDAAHAGNIVGGIAGQRLDLDHLVGADAKPLHHFGAGDTFVLHGVEQFDFAVHHQLHQVLVGGDNRHPGAGLAPQPCISGDQVVGLIAFHFDTGDAESARRVTHQGKLRNQIFRRRRTMRLVFLVELIAEGFLAGVENHCQMGRRVGLHVLQQLPQHVAVARHRAGGQAVRFAGERRQGVIGPEQIA